ncbi:MAG: hypothetical protein IT447_10675 [Phycisphaerales bacterium]|jgi:hypothetical protein|nr:hypothetical protein [Phycisphaerales bacterium]
MPVLSINKKLTDSSHLPPLDHWLWLATLLIALVVIPRSAMISWAHSGYIDDDWHIRRGLLFLTKNLSGRPISIENPPFADGMMVLPLVALGCTPDEPLNPATLPPGWTDHSSTNPKVAHDSLVYRTHVIFGHSLTPNVILLIIAIWKAFLWVPCAALIFHWCRALYGLGAAWLVTVMLLVEPNIAAHIPPASADILSAESFILLGFCAWRYFASPSRWKFALLTFATALVMQMKTSGIIAPFIVLLWAVFEWYIRPLRHGIPWSTLRPTLRPQFNKMLLAGILVVGWCWAMLLFDISIPRNNTWSISYTNPDSFVAHYLEPLLDLRWPGGLYIAAVVGELQHMRHGHWGFILGQHRIGGWWYYFPVLSTFKVPIGFGLVFLAAIFSLKKLRPRWTELYLILPLLVWIPPILMTRLNIGFRHVFAPYLLAIILSSRCMTHAGKIVACILWIAVITSGVHALSYHPDYLSYVNFPRHKPYLSINDSNFDWSQSLKEVAQWLDKHPQPGRPVYLGYFYMGDLPKPKLWFYLGDRVIPLERTEPPPTHGILIISPVWEAGLYYWPDTFAQLRAMEPDAIIGHCMLVYDLDKHAPPGKPFHWDPPPYRFIPGWHGPQPRPSAQSAGSPATLP